MAETALKLDQIYTSRFAVRPARPAHHFQLNGPTVIELKRRRRAYRNDFRSMVLEHGVVTSKPKRQRRKKVSLRTILQGGLEIGAFGTILATFMGSLWVLAQS